MLFIKVQKTFLFRIIFRKCCTLDNFIKGSGSAEHVACSTGTLKDDYNNTLFSLCGIKMNLSHLMMMTMLLLQC